MSALLSSFVPVRVSSERSAVQSVLGALDASRILVLGLTPEGALRSLIGAARFAIVVVTASLAASTVVTRPLSVSRSGTRFRVLDSDSGNLAEEGGHRFQSFDSFGEFVGYFREGALEPGAFETPGTPGTPATVDRIEFTLTVASNFVEERDFTDSGSSTLLGSVAAGASPFDVKSALESYGLSVSYEEALDENFDGTASYVVTNLGAVTGIVDSFTSTSYPVIPGTPEVPASPGTLVDGNAILLDQVSGSLSFVSISEIPEDGTTAATVTVLEEESSSYFE